LFGFDAEHDVRAAATRRDGYAPNPEDGSVRGELPMQIRTPDESDRDP
jgi:hypothetical protein